MLELTIICVKIFVQRQTVNNFFNIFEMLVLSVSMVFMVLRRIFDRNVFLQFYLQFEIG